MKQSFNPKKNRTITQQSIVDYHVIESAFNFSDHLPIALIIDANFDKTINQPDRNHVLKSIQKYYR